MSFCLWCKLHKGLHRVRKNETNSILLAKNHNDAFGFVKIMYKLDNVAINDVLPLKATRRDAIPNLKCFWGLGHHRPNFDGYIYIQYAAPPHSAPPV